MKLCGLPVPFSPALKFELAGSLSKLVKNAQNVYFELHGQNYTVVLLVLAGGCVSR